MEPTLEELLEKGREAWEVIKLLPPYKDKTLEEYLEFIKTHYELYNKMTPEEKEAYKQNRKEQIKRVNDHISELRQKLKNDKTNKNK